MSELYISSIVHALSFSQLYSTRIRLLIKLAAALGVDDIVDMLAELLAEAIYVDEVLVEEMSEIRRGLRAKLSPETSELMKRMEVKLAKIESHLLDILSTRYEYIPSIEAG